MPARLLAGRWSGTLGSETKQADSAFNNPEKIGIRWNIDYGGVQAIEITVKCRDEYDAYDRYVNHLGQRIAVYSHWCFRPISGFVTTISYVDARRIKYTAKGPYVRMTTEPDTTIYSQSTALGGSSGVIASVLSNMPTRIDDTTTDNIATNTSTLAGHNPKFPEGTYPLDFIKEVLSLSDTSNNIYDFWLLDQPFNGTTLQKWTPYYQPRSSSASIDWQVSRSEIKNLTLARNIDDTVTDANVYYARKTGQHSGANNASVLTDAGEDFLADGITPGDSITNITDGSRGQVESLTATTITPTSLNGGTDNDFDTNDHYNIDLKNITDQRKQTASDTAVYWKNVVNVFERQFNSTQASQWANALLHTEAVQVQAFTITSPWVRDGNGARWPLWEVIAQGGGYIRVNDLFPSAALFSESNDNKNVFIISSMDYDYTSNQLRVTVDNSDKRLDSRLRKARIVNSEIVARGTAWNKNKQS